MFPLPMTGIVPKQLRQWALEPPVSPTPITLRDDTVLDREPRVIGRGFAVEVRQAHLTFHRNEATLAEALSLTGWRIHVTNVPTETISLDQAITYYRGEWRVERGFHRFKGGSLPALPLFVRCRSESEGLCYCC